MAGLRRTALLAVILASSFLVAPRVHALAAFPTMTVLTNPATAGGTASISGSNFKPLESVTLYLQGVRAQSGSANAAGGFYASIAVPATFQPGSYSLQAAGASGDSAWASLIVAGAATPTPPPGTPPATSPTPTPSPVPSGSNLLQNGGFEQGQAPWSAYHALLALTSPGHSGSYALRATPWAPGQGLYYIVDYAGDNPWGVLPYGIPASRAGAYTAAAWVLGIPGRTIQLCVRDGTAGTIGGMSCASVTANGAWQQIAVTHNIASAGVKLDLWVGGYHYQSGDAFTVDDLSLLGP